MGEIILTLTNQAVFVTLCVVTIASIGAAIFILTLNHADVIGDQSDAVTQNAWFRRALCAAICGEISILIQTGEESWGRFPVPRICRWESIMHITRQKIPFTCRPVRYITFGNAQFILFFLRKRLSAYTLNWYYRAEFFMISNINLNMQMQ